MTQCSSGLVSDWVSGHSIQTPGGVTGSTPSGEGHSYQFCWDAKASMSQAPPEVGGLTREGSDVQLTLAHVLPNMGQFRFL